MGNKYVQSENYYAKFDEICRFKLIIYADESSFARTGEADDLFTNRAISVPGFKALTPVLTKPEPCLPERDDLAILQFSSGSTGHPKGVIVTHGMVMDQLNILATNYASMRNNAPIVSCASWMPMNHDMGLFVGALLPIYTACDNLLAPPAYYMRNPARWYLLMAEYRVNLSCTTNSALAITLSNISRVLKKNPPDLSCLLLSISAEKVSPVMLRRCYEVFPQLGLPIENIQGGYGMAENALSCAYTRNGTLRINRFVILPDQKLMAIEEDRTDSIELVSVGIADEGHEITIRDASDQVLPELTLGEINVEGLCVTPGYFNDPSRTQATINGKRLHTGDIGFFYEGVLYFYGRKDDMIIVGGRNLVPDDIEQCAEELAFIRATSTCLLATDNKSTGGTDLVLLVEKNIFDSAEVLEQQAALVQGHVFRLQEVLINRILFCKKGDIEKTSSGKKRRKTMLSRLINNQIEILNL
jgi:acyl-CoA synthetase (AMP-forming)/AMP-acid ligase II